MSDKEIDDKLREMAAHRGLKLVKSRRRKPGTGDFGRYGLTDAAGKALRGIAKAGLTASAEDIEAHLRAGTASDWKSSADIAPIAKNVRAPRKPAAPEPQPRHGHARPSPSPRIPDRRDKPVSPAAKPVPAPVLDIRRAAPADAAALMRLLDQLTAFDNDLPGLTTQLLAIRKAKGGVLVAELGGLVGCCAWSVLPTLQHGTIGRVTLLLVDKGHRRRGIATALVNAAAAAVDRAGCRRVEVMSDIAIANAHNFFRSLYFEQTSYRFARTVDAPS